MRRKQNILMLIFCVCSLNIGAQNSNANRKELYELLNERKRKFDSYSASLEKKSGIFGNKTKNDIRHSNEVLIEIVKTDNRIISTLNRVADFKDFEKVNLTYDVGANTAQLNNLLQATDTLAKQVDVLTENNQQLANKNQEISVLLYAAYILLSLIILVWFIKKIFRVVTKSETIH